MKIYRIFSIAVFRLLLITSLIGLGAVQADAGNRKTDSLDAGYSALRLFLKDEQHLTTIRRLKLVIGFESISDKSVKLIDDIADTSAEALDQLEQLAAARPVIVFEEFSDESIGKSTLDSLRYATAKEFLFETENFEKDLLLSQSHILRVISHLARQLEQKETNTRRKAWLQKIADRYETFYQQVYARLSVTGSGNA